MAQRIRDLDDRSFKNLVGCSRHELEEFARRADVLQQSNAAALPVGLYAILPQILDADADQARARAAQLPRAPRSQAWNPLPE